MQNVEWNPLDWVTRPSMTRSNVIQKFISFESESFESQGTLVLPSVPIKYANNLMFFSILAKQKDFKLDHKTERITFNFCRFEFVASWENVECKGSFLCKSKNDFKLAFSLWIFLTDTNLDDEFFTENVVPYQSLNEAEYVANTFLLENGLGHVRDLIVIKEDEHALSTFKSGNLEEKDRVTIGMIMKEDPEIGQESCQVSFDGLRLRFRNFMSKERLSWQEYVKLGLLLL